jgi:hypothetical protein
MSLDSPQPTSPSARVAPPCHPNGHKGPPPPIRSAATASNSGDAMFASSPIFNIGRSPSSIVVAARRPLPVKFPHSGRRPALCPLVLLRADACLEPLLLPRQASAAARPAPWRRSPGQLSGCRPPSGHWSCLARTHVAEAHPPPSPRAGGHPACSIVTWGSPGREVQWVRE